MVGKALEPVLAWAKDTLLKGRASSLDPILQISRLNPVWFFPEQLLPVASQVWLLEATTAKHSTNQFYT